MWQLEHARTPTLILRDRHQRLALRLPIRALALLFSLLALILAVVVCSLMLGSYEMTVAEAWQTLFHPDTSSQLTTIIWEFRFPRTLASVLVGAMMALSGATLQNVTRNGLADPSLVGISQGAGLAVVALTILWPEQIVDFRPLVALGGALFIAGLIQLLSWRRQGGASLRFILMGIGIAAFISALTSALMTYGQVNRAMSALTWLSGSIHAVGWGDVRLLALWFALLLPWLLMLSRSMAALQMGEATAGSLGVSVSRVRTLLTIVAVAFAAIATATVGPLGFVGLIAPHAARRLVRSGIGLHLLLTATLGGLLVTLADLIGRTLFAPIQIPAGLITAVIGVPIFIVLLQRAQARASL